MASADSPIPQQNGSSFPQSLADIKDPKSASDLVSYSVLSVAEMQQRGVPPHITQLVERNREQLMRTLEWQRNFAKTGQAQTAHFPTAGAQMQAAIDTVQQLREENKNFAHTNHIINIPDAQRIEYNAAFGDLHQRGQAIASLRGFHEGINAVTQQRGLLLDQGPPNYIMPLKVVKQMNNQVMSANASFKNWLQLAFPGHVNARPTLRTGLRRLHIPLVQSALFPPAPPSHIPFAANAEGTKDQGRSKPRIQPKRKVSKAVAPASSLAAGPSETKPPATPATPVNAPTPGGLTGDKRPRDEELSAAAAPVAKKIKIRCQVGQPILISELELHRQHHGRELVAEVDREFEPADIFDFTSYGSEQEAGSKAETPDLLLQRRLRCIPQPDTAKIVDPKAEPGGDEAMPRELWRATDGGESAFYIVSDRPMPVEQPWALYTSSLQRGLFQSRVLHQQNVGGNAWLRASTQCLKGSTILLFDPGAPMSYSWLRKHRGSIARLRNTHNPARWADIRA
ncbi:hypothetical protein C8Q80DRAFT_1124112 [Daedaleopsis nitida]|nr:hypothetical protein C8Q80DRAFT_1124112 [Daedaleopsis nitida]